MAPDDTLVTKDAALVVGVKPATLTTWRCTRRVTIPYVKIGRKVVYRRADLERWLTAHTVDAQPQTATT